MFKNPFKRIFGAGSPEKLTGDVKEIYSCLEYCEKVSVGLTGRMVNYIETGDDRTVLSVLANSKQAVDAALTQRRKERAARDKTGRTNEFSRTPEEALLAKVICRTAGQPDRVSRMAEIGSAAFLKYRSAFHYVHRSQSNILPPTVIFLLKSLSGDYFDDVPEDQRLRFEDVMAVAALHGIGYQELFASGYWIEWVGVSYYRSAIAMGPYGNRWLTDAYQEAFYNGIRRCEAWYREAILNFCLEHKLQPKGDALVLWFRFMADGSAKVRDIARKLIIASDDPRKESMAVEGLDSKTATYRSAMVQILGDISSETARDALEKRLKVEKTRSVQLLIEQFLSATETPLYDPDRPGYEAVDGTWVEIPAVVRLEDSDEKPFGEADEKALRAIAEEEFTKDLARWEKYKDTPHHQGWKRPKPDTRWKNLLEICNGGEGTSGSLWHHLYYGWLRQELPRIPPVRIARIWAKSGLHSFSFHGDEPATMWMLDRLEDGVFDIRTAIDIHEVAAEKRGLAKAPEHRKPEPNTPPYERAVNLMLERWDYTLTHLPKIAIWPLIASHLPVLADNLPPGNLDTTKNLRAIRMLGQLPALPRAFVPNLVAACMAEARTVRMAAQNLLRDVDGITPQIVDALADSRQAIRANAASFLGQRGDSSALPELIKHLGKEKSETARAAMISAVAALGGDTSKWLGHAALEKEAKAGAAKLNGDKIDWLDTSTAPVLRWSDGRQADNNLLPGWLRLAVKLKSIEDGAGLFTLYLDQLDTQSAEALGNWVLSAWISYDTYRRPREEVFREQLIKAKDHIAKHANSSRYFAYEGHTPESLAALWTSHEQGQYPNSGATSKGILALTLRAAPELQSRLVSGYLKEHGRRVAQAKTLLEVLAHSGSSEGLQVIVATSTRFKQRTVRETAASLVARIAEERDWSADELADRSVPTGGLDETGVLDLPVGEEEKLYRARIGSDLQLHLYNPEGRKVKSLPAGQDANTKESKAALALAKKTIKTVTQQQSSRLYEAMLSSRCWSRDDWEADLRNHPIMSRLTERVIWRGLDRDGAAITCFRPTAEGDLLTADGDDADLTDVAQIDLAHGATIPDEAHKAWQQHLKDFETEPLFKQISRPVLAVGDDQKKLLEIDDRKGWMLENLKLRSLATKLGYDQGETLDGGGYTEYEKRFPSTGVLASIQFSGSYHGADNHPIALISLKFSRLTASGRSGRDIPLGDVPPLLLSECWNDFHGMAAAGAFDPEWQKKGLW